MQHILTSCSQNVNKIKTFDKIAILLFIIPHTIETIFSQILIVSENIKYVGNELVLKIFFSKLDRMVEGSETRTLQHLAT